MGNLSQYEVGLASLSEGKHERVFVCNPSLFEAMENDDVLDCSVEVKLTITRRGDYYTFNFDCKGELIVSCDRCLDPLTLPIDTQYELQVRYGFEYDDSIDNVLILPEHQTVLDLAPIIYTTLMLCIPIQKVHAPGHCNSQMEEMLREHGVEEVDELEED